MSFQDLDFKSGRISVARPEIVVRTSGPSHLKITAKLLLVATLIMLLGFSVSNWQPSAKAADSTLKLARLHYPLPLPQPIESAHLEKPAPVNATGADPWQSVTIESGDTLASILAARGVTSSTTHTIARLNEQT